MEINNDNALEMISELKEKLSKPAEGEFRVLIGRETYEKLKKEGKHSKYKFYIEKELPPLDKD